MSGRELFEAARDGDLDSVSGLVRVENIELDYRGEDDDTPLTIALYNKHEKIALALIKAGANVNLQNNNMHSPLFIAVASGMSLAIITELLTHGARANFHFHRNFTVLDCALDKGYFSVAELILNHDKSIIGRDVDKALMLAAYGGQLDIVKELTARGAGLNYRTIFKNNALIGAFEKKHYDVVLYLIGAGADLNCKTTLKTTFSTLVSRMAESKDKENILAAIEGLKLQKRRLSLVRMLTTFGATNVEKEKCPDKAPATPPMPMLAAAGAGAGAGSGAEAVESAMLAASVI